MSSWSLARILLRQVGH